MESHKKCSKAPARTSTIEIIGNLKYQQSQQMFTASSTSSLNGMSFFRHVQLLLPMPRLRFHLILSGLEVLKLLTSATSVRLVHCNRAQKWIFWVRHLAKAHSMHRSYHHFSILFPCEFKLDHQKRTMFTYSSHIFTVQKPQPICSMVLEYLPTFTL